MFFVLKLIIGVIIFAVILSIAGIGYFVLSDDNGPIPPDDGTDEPDNGSEQENPEYAIKITAPNNPYNIPSDGDQYGGYGYIKPNTRIYGTDVDQVKKISFKWKNTEYGKRNIDSSSDKWTVIDEYNIDISDYILIERLASGEHTLEIKIYDNSNNMLDTTDLEVVIPDYWIYPWDSREDNRPSDFEDGDYYYKFRRVYQTEIPSKEYKYLHGEVHRVKGKFLMDTTQSGEWYININIWNYETEKWYIWAESHLHTGYGWYDIDRQINGGDVYGLWISFAGDNIYNVNGFVGDIYVKPGTYYYQQTPLQMLLNIFDRDSFDNCPMADI